MGILLWKSIRMQFFATIRICELNTFWKHFILVWSYYIPKIPIKIQKKKINKNGNENESSIGEKKSLTNQGSCKRSWTILFYEFIVHRFIENESSLRILNACMLFTKWSKKRWIVAELIGFTRLWCKIFRCRSSFA